MNSYNLTRGGGGCIPCMRFMFIALFPLWNISDFFSIFLLLPLALLCVLFCFAPPLMRSFYFILYVPCPVPRPSSSGRLLRWRKWRFPTGAAATLSLLRRPEHASVSLLFISMLLCRCALLLLVGLTWGLLPSPINYLSALFWKMTVSKEIAVLVKKRREKTGEVFSSFFYRDHRRLLQAEQGGGVRAG